MAPQTFSAFSGGCCVVSGPLEEMHGAGKPPPKNDVPDDDRLD